MRPAILLSTLLLLASADALAQTPPPATPFEQHKAALAARLQARIAHEQAMLSCVQAAANRAALKACKHMAPR